MEELRKSALKIINTLEKAYPEARLELDFTTPFELLIATILAAQSTDVRVNKVTKDLFEKYREPADYLKVDITALEQEIRSTGFYRNKAKSVVGCCNMIVNEFGGDLPRSVEELVKLPGVGRKTANIVLANAMGIPAIGVDTHATRVPNRLGWVNTKNADKIEAILTDIFPEEKWQRANILIVWHGRYTCQAKKPKCGECVIYDSCPWEEKTSFN